MLNGKLTFSDAKPCPVCGKKPKILRDHNWGYQALVEIECKRLFRRCHASVWATSIFMETAEDNAVRSWNNIKPYHHKAGGDVWLENNP